jgi:hypothetical protein
MLLDKYQKLLSKDIESIICYIFDNYNVVSKETNEIVDKNNVVSHFLSDQKQIIQRCCGVLNSGNQCHRSAIKNEMYCKTHLLKYQKTTIQNKKQELESVTFISNENECNLNECPKNDLKKIFIDNTLFLHDNQFLYDFLSKEKVGYKNEQEEFIITNDPFILCSF